MTRPTPPTPPAPPPVNLEKEAAGHGWAWGKALHGLVVLPARDGGSQTVQLQRGVITAVHETTITVRSTDNFTRTWTVSTSTRVIVPRAPERRRVRGRAATESPSPTATTAPTSTTSTTAPTSTTSTTAPSSSGPVTTGKLTEGLTVRVWGVGDGDAPVAQVVFVEPRAPQPPSPTVTSPTVTSPTVTSPTVTSPTVTSTTVTS